MVRRLIHLALSIMAMLIGVGAMADPYPMGALAFFNGDCPEGWGPATSQNGLSLNGYFLVPFAPSATEGKIGTTVNSALGNLEARTHTHGFSSTFTLPEMTWAGVSGCHQWLKLCDHAAASGEVSFSGTTSASDSGMPYVQLMLCMKTQFAKSTNPPVGIPGAVVTFFTSLDCPTGWKPTLSTAGRLIVGLPEGGIPQATFNGDPLSVGEDRTHTHAFSGSVTAGNIAVDLVPGGQAKGYAKKGSYTFSGTTAAASTGLPYAIVTQCQACLAGDDDPACAGQQAAAASKVN